jgi:hypothetical protein
MRDPFGERAVSVQCAGLDFKGHVRAADSRELTERLGSSCNYFAQSRIMENDIGRQAVGVRQLLAQGAQSFE